MVSSQSCCNHTWKSAYLSHNNFLRPNTKKPLKMSTDFSNDNDTLSSKWIGVWTFTCVRVLKNELAIKIHRIFRSPVRTHTGDYQGCMLCSNEELNWWWRLRIPNKRNVHVLNFRLFLVQINRKNERSDAMIIKLEKNRIFTCTLDDPVIVNRCWNIGMVLWVLHATLKTDRSVWGQWMVIK